MNAKSNWIEDPEDRREFIRRASILGLSACGIGIGIPMYTSVISKRRSAFANELVSGAIPELSPVQKTEREVLPKYAKDRIAELFQALAFNTAEFAHDLRAPETVRFLGSLAEERRATVVSQLFIVRAGVSRLSTSICELGTKLGDDIDTRWTEATQEIFEKWGYSQQDTTKFANLDLSSRCESHIRSSIQSLSTNAYELAVQASTGSREKLLGSIGSTIALGGAIASLPAIALSAGVTLPMLSIPVFLLGGVASLAAFAYSPAPMSPEQLQRELTSYIKDAGVQSSLLFAKEFRQNLTNLHNAEVDALKEAASFVASKRHPYPLGG